MWHIIERGIEALVLLGQITLNARKSGNVVTRQNPPVF
jgi:hypothetical protein